MYHGHERQTTHLNDMLQSFVSWASTVRVASLISYTFLGKYRSRSGPLTTTVDRFYLNVIFALKMEGEVKHVTIWDHLLLLRSNFRLKDTSYAIIFTGGFLEFR